MQYNFENLKKIEITNSSIVNFLSATVLKTCFTHGWIGGGFARKVASIVLDRQQAQEFEQVHELPAVLNRFQNYKNFLNPFSDYFNEQKGDIDFFFHCKDQAYMTAKHIEHSHPDLYRPAPSGPFAKNFYMSAYKSVVKIQIVTAFPCENVKNMFESFDFINSCYAIVSPPSDKTRFYLVYHPRAWECDSKKALEIIKSNSPYSLSRIKKYLTYRNLSYISKESQEELQSILIRAATDMYEKKFSWNPLSNYIERCIKWLFKTGYVDTEQAILFLGKYQHLDQSNNYEQVVIKDWAINQLQKQEENKIKVSL